MKVHISGGESIQLVLLQMRAKNIIHSSHHASNGSTTPLLIRGAHRCVEWERDDHDHHNARACA